MEANLFGQELTALEAVMARLGERPYRARQIYTGPDRREYVPIDQRGS